MTQLLASFVLLLAATLFIVFGSVEMLNQSGVVLQQLNLTNFFGFADVSFTNLLNEPRKSTNCNPQTGVVKELDCFVCHSWTILVTRDVTRVVLCHIFSWGFRS